MELWGVIRFEREQSFKDDFSLPMRTIGEGSGTFAVNSKVSGRRETSGRTEFGTPAQVPIP
jgi:hypothetical protein